MANPQQASMHNHTSSRVGRFSSGNRFVSMDNFFVPATPGNVSSYYDPHTPLTVMSNPTPLAGRLSMHPAPGVYCACPHQLNCPYSQGLVFNPGPPAGPNGFGGPGGLNGPNGSNPFNWPGNGNAFFNSQTPNAPFSSGPGYQGADHFSQAATLNPGPLQTMRTPTGYVTQNLEALTQREPAIPRAVPSVWNDPAEVNLSKSLENREGIRNVYIRGLHPNTTDQMIYDYAIRFGDIERCKAIVDLDTGTCKGCVIMLPPPPLSFTSDLAPFPLIALVSLSSRPFSPARMQSALFITWDTRLALRNVPAMLASRIWRISRPPTSIVPISRSTGPKLYDCQFPSTILSMLTQDYWQRISAVTSSPTKWFRKRSAVTRPLA